ncbi:MAG TPA: G8 domain-containing protein [Nitrosomonas sp.]|nr:G8 domain-containing protein [Nitrosomonas sp.]
MIKGARIIIVVTFCFFITNVVCANQEGELDSDNKNLHPPVVLDDEPAVITTAKDVVPNFVARPTIVSKQSGNWFDPATWQENRIPDADDVVKVERGHAVHYNGINDAALAALGIRGTLTFDTGANTRIKVGTILVYRQGKLDIGTLSNPVAPFATAEIIIANRPLAVFSPDPATGIYDPQQFGTGIVAFGEVNMHGKGMTPTWVRLAQEPRAGQNTLTLEASPSGWSAGDKLVLPDTRQTPLIRKWQIEPIAPIALQLEELIIADISDNIITLSQPLQYDHLGGRDTDGNIIAMPHIGNLTRNIVVRSEDPNGVRGHIMFTERANVDVRYAAFVNMGRTTALPLDNTLIEDGTVTHIGTNQIGRYPVHMHHLMGPINEANDGYQFVFVGNAVENGAKWGITVHNSHFGLVDNNVVYDVEGAGIITEEGNERENVFSNNFVVKVGTIIASNYDPTYGGVAGDGRPLKFADFGYEGSALWFTGNNDHLTGNVAANAAFAGVMYNARSRGFWTNQPLVPNFRGADIDDLTQWTEYSNTWAPEIKLSKHNEVYASSVGIWVGFAGIIGNISDYLLWNIKQTGLYSQRNVSASYHNITMISDQSVSNQNFIGTINKGIDLANPNYQSGHTVFKNIRVEGFNLGVDLPAFLQPEDPQLGELPSKVTFIDNGYLRNYVNVREHSPIMAPKYTLLKDVEFVQNAGPENKHLSLTPAAIVTLMERTFSLTRATNLSRFFIWNYNKQQGDNFEMFFYEQAPGYVMEERRYPLDAEHPHPYDNCPTVGLTNQQCWDQHGVAMLRKIATCEDTYRSEIQGFTCPVDFSDELQ